MKKKKKDPDIITRTISDHCRFSQRIINILKFMSHESKNIYNTSIFHTQIFLRYSNLIYKKLWKLVKTKDVTNVTQFDSKLFEIYDRYYKHHLSIRFIKKYNNNVIYQLIKENIDGVDLVNNNYYFFEEFIIRTLYEDNLLKFPPNCSIETEHEIFYDIVSKILQSIYNKNFQKTKNEIINREKCTIEDPDFIKQVKDNMHLFPEKINGINYKKRLQKHRLFKPEKKVQNKKSKNNKIKKSKPKGIKSDQNYIGRIIYKYYLNPKIPSDLMCNIIKKSYEAHTSFFALRKKGIKANIPKFLDKDGHYILPFYARSKKEVQKGSHTYYRLTVGSYVSNNFAFVIDDKRVVCIEDSKENKKYIDRKYLIKINPGDKIYKKDNYIIGDYYVPKNSKQIMDGYYIYIRRSEILENEHIKLIEICPQYDGHSFEINYVYDIKKTKNKPVRGKCISMDLGIDNLMAIYDPEGEQFLIKGKELSGFNKFINKKIDESKSNLTKNKPSKKSPKDTHQKEIKNWLDYVNGVNNNIPPRKTNNDLHTKMINQEYNEVFSPNTLNVKKIHQTTSINIRELLIYRKNKINDIFNKIVSTIIKKYSKCETIIVGYNEGWKTGVNMGRANNRNFYDIPYRKLLNKLRDALEKNNQKLVIINESYTSKCDALSLEKICFHEKYMGTRITRSLYSSATKVLINADINGAINIMRKWKEKEGIKMNKITGKKICNPRRLNIHEA